MTRLIYVMIMIFLFALAPLGAFSMHHETGKTDVKIAEKEGIGNYLTDAEGKTLYWFEKDSPGTSACAGVCIERWPAFYRESVSAPEGISKEDFGTLEREDGTKQTTFREYPLYYWVGDSKPGDTTGHGVNDVWFVVDPGNFPPK